MPGSPAATPIRTSVRPLIGLYRPRWASLYIECQSPDISSAAYYANRGGAIVDLKGKKLGTCKVAPEQNFYCGIPAGRAEGTRKLDCTSSLTAKDFKQPS